MLEKDIFGSIAETIVWRGAGREELDAPKLRPHRDVNQYIDVPPMCDWLRTGSHISDDSIRKVASRLPDKLKKSASVDKVIADILKIRCVEQPNYDRFVKHVCGKVLSDLEENEGKELRSLIRKIDFLILSQVVGNEDMRDWLKVRPGKANVFDLEEVVVEATILFISSVGSQDVDELVEKFLTTE